MPLTSGLLAFGLHGLHGHDMQGAGSWDRQVHGQIIPTAGEVSKTRPNSTHILLHTGRITHNATGLQAPSEIFDLFAIRGG